jgi:signal transduction histidine kinase
MSLLMAFLFGMGITAFVSFIYSAWQRKEIEQRLYGIIHGSPIPSFVIKKDHKVIYWNDALEKLSGIKSRDIMGTDEHWRAFYKSQRPCMADLIVDETLESVPNWYSGKFSKSSLLEKTYVATDFFPDLGEGGRWLRFTASAIKDSMGNMFGAIETLEDITEQRLAEEELMRIKTLESMGQFAGEVARDFDSLMSAVLRNIFLAKLSAADEDKILEEGLATAERASLQAKELAHQLITFAKGGYPFLKLESVNGLLNEIAGEVNAPGIRCDVSVREGLWPVEIDSGQIKRVIGNMVQNAIEAMPEGGTIHLSAENKRITEKDRSKIKTGSYLKISIRDSGHGIKSEHLSRIFDPYFTTKKTSGRKGLGLGLSLCYSIMKNHNGFITVESEPDKGTAFHIFIPAPSEYPNL